MGVISLGRVFVLLSFGAFFSIGHAQAQSGGPLQKRIVKVERKMAALLKTTKTVVNEVDDAKDLAAQANSKAEQLDQEVEAVGDTTNEVMKTVDDLTLTVSDLLGGKEGNGRAGMSSWTITSVVPSGQSGFTTVGPCEVTFTETSKDEGTFVSSPKLCLGANAWLIRSGKYKIHGDTMYVYEPRDSNGGNFGFDDTVLVFDLAVSSASELLAIADGVGGNRSKLSRR
jgi:hypothetical protein